MDEKVVRCPYCVLAIANDFRPRFHHTAGLLKCTKCEHEVSRRDRDFICNCRNCQKLRFPSGSHIGRAS
jgi:hypothetical protein